MTAAGSSSPPSSGPVDSFRAYLDRLAAAGDLNRLIEPISWNLEASAVTMLANRHDAAVPVFEVPDADPDGHRGGERSNADTRAGGARLVGDPYRGTRRHQYARIAAALDLPVADSDAYYEAVIERLRSPVAPTVVDREAAPCKTVVRTDPDLLAFPWPYLHAGDGGRYSNLHTLIAPDRESDWTDWSPHRLMIHDRERASLLLLAGEQTPNLYYYGYERHDEPMPVAVAVGAEPAVTCTAEMWIPTGRDEAEFAGGLKRGPVELVPAETSDLLVPATAELVLEGRVLPGERLDEGPYGDYVGYAHGPRRSMPALVVDAITHRERPHIPFRVEGADTGYTHNTTAAMETACVGPDATLGLRAAGFDVAKLAPWTFAPRTAYVIAAEKRRPGHFHELANFIFTTWGMLHVDFFVFVDADVDPLDYRAVLEALALHADPDADFHQFGVETMPKVPLNIYQTPEEKGDAATGTSKAKTAKAYIDATRGDEATAVTAVELTADRRERARATLRAAGVELAPSGPDTVAPDGDADATRRADR